MQTKYYDQNGQLVRYVIDEVEQPLDGLGTQIEKISQPIARAIDKIAGTNISGCGSCKAMRDRLNAGMTLSEASKIRIIEFALRRLNQSRVRINKKVDKRLRSKGK